MGKVKISVIEAEQIIDKMIRDIGANDIPATRKLYGKAVHNLPKAIIFSHIESAQKASTSKPGLLRWLLNKEFHRLGI